MDLYTSIARFIATAAWPLRWLKKPCERVERHLGLTLGDTDRRAVLRACARDGATIGRYYHWYLEKLLVARRLNVATRSGLLDLVKATDVSEFEALDRILDNERSAVLALPHFGHYMLAALSIVTRYSATRDVGLFYGDPTTHRGNKVFDDVHASRFNTPADTRIHVFHANRSGMVDALRLLRGGGLLIMMPDVHLKADETYLVPFVDHAYDVMLGSAAIARKTESALIPILPEPTGPLRFKIRFGEPIEATADLRDAATSAHYAEWLDYTVTAALFEEYERWMSGHMLLWQYVREHFLREASFVNLSPKTLEQIWPAFFSDPRTRSTGCPTPIDLSDPKVEP